MTFLRRYEVASQVSTVFLLIHNTTKERQTTRWNDDKEHFFFSSIRLFFVPPQTHCKDTNFNPRRGADSKKKCRLAGGKWMSKGEGKERGGESQRSDYMVGGVIKSDRWMDGWMDGGYSSNRMIKIGRHGAMDTNGGWTWPRWTWMGVGMRVQCEVNIAKVEGGQTNEPRLSLTLCLRLRLFVPVPRHFCLFVFVGI